jgi:intein/homing endonuclease
VKIEKFSHHFVVSGFNQVEKEAILKFVLRFAETSFDRFGNKVIVRTYAASTKSRKEFRFHINSFDSFSLHIQERGLIVPDEDVITYTLYEPVKVVYGKLQKDPRDYQVPIIAFNLMPSPLAKLITLQPGYGKALEINAPILTPVGWRPIGSLKINDLVVEPNGFYTRVTGVYPQGTLKMYRVTFSDGRSIRCCKEHLWKVFYKKASVGKQWRVINTEELIRLTNQPDPRVYIPLPEPWLGKNDELPLDPYLLGALIGDGCFTSNAIIFSNNDQHVVDKVNGLLNKIGYKLSSKSNICDYRIIYNGGDVLVNLKESLETLGLLNKYSHEKFIPNIYRDSTIDNRWSLLQGLMDTDGDAIKGGSAYFNTSSEQLMLDVQYLTRSLKGMGKIESRIPKYTHKEEILEGRLAYRMCLRMATPSNIFTLPRKAERIGDSNQYTETLKLRVDSVIEDGEDDAVCISVEHKDKLYVTNDFIVTHNTFIALATVAASEQRFVLATKGGFVTRWLRDCCGDDSVLGLINEDIIVVKGSEALKVVIQLALTDQLEFKGLLISTNTLNNYYKHYFDNDGDMSEYGGLHPVALWQLLNVGILITDEFHMLIHMNFIREMYNHVPKTIALSGTMIPDGPFMKLIHDTLFPKECIAPEPAYTKYIAVKALFYGIHADTKEIKCFRNAKYSHTMYEESIINKPKVLKRYTDMLLQMGVNIYDREGRHEPGEKMIIYVSTQDMATRLTDIYKAHFGDKYIINRFVSLDPYSHVEDSDIIISTPGSLGTAHDVYKLRYTLLTTALGKEDTNIQLLFRLRKPTWNPEVTPEMYYLVNREVKKHMDYHYRKRELFKPITLSQIELETPFKV